VVRFDRRRGDELVRRILAGDEDGMLGYHLLQEVVLGYPMTAVPQLLHSALPTAVSAGAFIVEELGSGAAPLAPEFRALLHRAEPRVRDGALDAVMVNASVCDEHTLADAVALVDDPHVGVRRRAMRLLAVVPLDDLRRGLPSIQNPTVRANMVWLTADRTEATLAREAMARLDADDPVTRRFATATALRVVGSTDVPLRRAAQARDRDAGEYAAFELGLIDERRRSGTVSD
jgi:hypothetical protein